MDATDIAWLRTPEGLAATERATALLAGSDELRALRALTRDVTSEQARAAVSLVRGRKTAATKLPDGAALFCDRQAAEQTSDHRVARHLAQRFAILRYVADLGCGMGGDALAIAEFAPVLAVDRDPARLAMTEANASVRALDARLTTEAADLLTWDVPAHVDAVWCDPARRDEGERRLRPESWSPPLSRALALGRAADGAGIKLAPGIELEALPTDAEIEFVSFDRGLRAAVAWLGTLARGRRTATVLDDNGGAVVISGEPDTHATPLGAPGAYLYDLDPSVGRAGLLDTLAPTLAAWKLDDEIAYLSADEAHDTPFARRLRVLATCAFAERRILELLHEHEAGRVDVVRRGSPVDTNQLERRLNRALASSTSTRALVVVLTRVRGEHTALVCERDASEVSS
ncbi:MAG: class I SAM-dependent methyltransferase [Chloroflexi bacterium]|nr:MAG: class I SAM-dependent methyltransferase [Chloroflexota bacterium]